jgi:hypothetical protein
MNFGRLGGWLEGEARRGTTGMGKVAHFESRGWAQHPNWFARACCKSKSESLKTSPSRLLKRQKFKMFFFQSRRVAANQCQIELDHLLAEWHLDGKHYANIAKPPLLLRG